MNNEEPQIAGDLAQQNKALKKLNKFALELSVLSSEENLEAFITHQIKEFAGARAAIFSEYNSSNRTITPKHIEIESFRLEKLIELLGTQIQNIHSIVSEELYKEITTEMVGIRKTIYEASFGILSRPVGAAIEALLNVDRFIGVVYLIEGKLFGTSLLAMGKGKPDPPKELLENFAHLAATSLRRKISERQIKESEEKYHLIADNISDVITKFDLKTFKCTYVSPSVFNNTGYTVEEFYSKNMLDLFAQGSLQVMKQNLGKRLDEFEKGGYSYANNIKEYQMLHKNGSTHWVESSTSIIKDDSGKPVELIVVSRNIEERKKAEMALIEGEKKLRQLNADKDKFFSIIAHDLRSPFNFFLGYTQKMAEEMDSMTSGEIHETAAILNKSATNLYNLLDNLLNWTRMKQGLIPYRPQEVVLAEVCQDSISVLKQNAEAKKISINYLLDGDLILYADVEMLKTILRNLLSNAIKYTNEGGAINIRAEKAFSSVIVSVSDNGIGIPSAELGKLFEISDVQSTKGTLNEHGTGLGLLLCKEFIEKHNGRIWVESEVGKGSEFKFLIPEFFNP